VTAVTARRDAGHSQTFGLALDYNVLFCRDGTMKGQRQNKHRTLTRAARVLAAAGVILSLLSIQQVWAEAFCACDHQNPSSSASEHCGKHAAQHQHCEEAHVVSTHQHATQTEHNEDADRVATHQHAAQIEHNEAADSVATHQHAAQNEHAEESHSLAIQKQAESSCGHHTSRDSEPAGGHHASRDTEPFGSSGTAQLEGATSTPESDGSTTPATLSCCHIMPAANLPATSAAVYSADVATDSTPVVFEIGAARAVVASTVLHPPRTRPIYLAVSSLLI
jgi:hypothetical protein